MTAHSVSRETLASLTSAQQLQIDLVLAALEADEHAPTAIREPQRASQAHVADSLAALELDALSGAGRIADLGSGAGFPGLALAVALPEAEVSLIESQRRKCEFLERLCAAAGVENARVVCTRAEEWGAGLGTNDAVLARALAPQAVVLEYAAPLLRVGGTLVDWRGRRDQAAEGEADRAAALLGLARDEVRRVIPFEGASDHHLHVFTKVRETPSRFPRRPGIARKRPLGS
ncbi:MAG TPA: 16S rRNA (guanine(527)-N(7))-methyltransferase RsmG [Solirubrobacteraceae bacterium]|jgi:16S rRNA (guanine527-N7)-methyltransferase|nr:16S rRNA (guanine(527)-N(7))-methyltransferase RsmG [Solirubrobacteraceae bacterium]